MNKNGFSDDFLDFMRKTEERIQNGKGFIYEYLRAVHAKPPGENTVDGDMDSLPKDMYNG